MSSFCFWLIPEDCPKADVAAMSAQAVTAIIVFMSFSIVWFPDQPPSFSDVPNVLERSGFSNFIGESFIGEGFRTHEIPIFRDPCSLLRPRFDLHCGADAVCCARLPILHQALGRGRPR
jgi:hypothetical protein